jgi:hypothetical protein
MKLDFFMKMAIESDFRRVAEILDSNIFDPQNVSHPLVQSAFIELLIRVRDLMAKTEKLVKRIDFNDDVIKTSSPNGVNDVNDVTDFIEFVRNAACHPESDKHFLEPQHGKFTFSVASGMISILARPGEKTITSDYDDDVCFFFGPQRIYLKSHLLRAIEQARTQLSPLLGK